MASFVSGLAIQPRGLRENNWIAPQPSSAPSSKASCKPPLIGRCAPMRGIVDWLIDSLFPSVHFVIRYRTGSGRGSPRGQPAWGGGCDPPYSGSEMIIDEDRSLPLAVL